MKVNPKSFAENLGTKLGEEWIDSLFPTTPRRDLLITLLNGPVDDTEIAVLESLDQAQSSKVVAKKSSRRRQIFISCTKDDPSTFELREKQKSLGSWGIYDPEGQLLFFAFIISRGNGSMLPFKMVRALHPEITTQTFLNIVARKPLSKILKLVRGKLPRSRNWQLLGVRVRDGIVVDGMSEIILQLVTARNSRTTQYLFKRNGGTWNIAFASDTFTMEDMDGLAYIQQLLRSSPDPVHWWTLYKAVQGPPEARATSESVETAKDDTRHDHDFIDQLIDEMGIDDLNTFIDDNHEAMKHADAETREAYSKNIQKAEAHLRSCTTERGKPKDTGVRTNTINKIRNAIERVITKLKKDEGCSPELALHFRSCISYRGNPRYVSSPPIQWTTR